MVRLLLVSRADRANLLVVFPFLLVVSDPPAAIPHLNQRGDEPPGILGEVGVVGVGHVTGNVLRAANRSSPGRFLAAIRNLPALASF